MAYVADPSECPHHPDYASRNRRSGEPDDLTFVVTHFLPHLNRGSIWRILRSEGLSRRALPVSAQPARGQGVFRDHDLGFIHIDIKHLPKLQTADGERRKRYLYAAIDRSVSPVQPIFAAIEPIAAHCES